MPQITDITVKKSNGTTDITYSQVVASSGGNSPAIWRSPEGDAAAHRPTLSVLGRDNGNRTARELNYEFRYPYVVTAADGSKRISDMPRMTLKLHNVTSVPQVVIDEFVHQGLNLFASNLSKAQGTSGFAAT